MCWRPQFTSTKAIEVSEICQVYFNAGWNELTELRGQSSQILEKCSKHL